MKTKIFLLILGIFFLSFTSAYSVTLTVTPSSLNLNSGASSTISIHYVIENTNGLAGANGVSLSGTPNFLTYSGGSVSYGANTTTAGDLTINVNIPSGTNVGDYTNTVSISGNSVSIPIHVSASTECQINPSLASFTQTVQTGSEIPLPKITFSPTNCIGTMVFDSSHIYIEGGIVIGGLTKPVSISSITSDGVNLNVNTQGLSSQTYQTKLKVNAFNKNFEIPINIIVTGSSGVSGNLTENDIPSCSLTNNVLNLNQSYSLVCNAVTDISIRPRIDNSYIIGLGREVSATQFKWNFRALKMGTTTIYADFYFGDTPFGNSFSQEVKITPSGTNIAGGTDLSLNFFQDGIKRSLNELRSEVNTTILVLDNRTNNLVSNYLVILNGVATNISNYIFSIDKSYELRVSSPGYLDLVISNLTVKKNSINLIISPSKSLYDVGETINLSSDVNASFLVNDVIVGNTYTINSEGNITIKAVKDGYANTIISINASVPASVLAVTPEYSKWKEGDTVSLKLSKSVNWVVYKESTLIAQNTSDTVNFKIDSIGTYQVKTGNYLITNKTIEKNNFWAFLQNKYFWIILGGIVVIVFVILFFKNKSSSSDSGLNFQTAIN